MCFSNPARSRRGLAHRDHGSRHKPQVAYRRRVSVRGPARRDRAPLPNQRV